MARAAAVRMPLDDGSKRVNTSPAPPSHKKRKHAASTSTGGPPPHHDSLMPGAPLTARNKTELASKRSTAQNTPLDSKRVSQISSTSTNATAHGRRRKTHIGPWELGADLGRGGCGKVRKVRHKITGHEAAAKIISKRVAETTREESLASLVENSRKSNAGTLAAGETVIPFGIEREVVIMKLLKHPNVVQLYDVWENRNELYLIMEYVNGGELFSFIEEREYLDEDEAVYLFRQMVAALLHCHRLGIHHRDLKPENILLEQHTNQVKLVDFGMAALQPKGKLLTTPCGSVHYAAPEVFERSYDGSKVDVWSLGIILHVMLTGCVPFSYDQKTMNNDVRLWYDVIKAGEFPLDESLSPEAQDLLLRMLTPSFKDRISIDEVWHHPFVHKYEAEWGESPEDNDIQKWVGTAPIIENWNIHSVAGIDREILRNLRTLWHSEKEQVIVKRLLNKELNQEKYFYAALQKYREEQLESYLAGTDGTTFLTNDHHLIVNKKTTAVTPLVTTKSQFSILNNEHLSRSTLPEPDRATSSDSYDPYRSSGKPATADRSNNLNVTVHRRSSKQSLDRSAASQQRPVSRLDVSRGGGRTASRVSSSASLKPPSIAPSLAGSRHSVISRQSLPRSASKQSLQRSAIVIPVVKKRGVNFGHPRRSSTASALPTPTKVNQGIHSARKATKYGSTPNVAVTSSPQAASIVVKSRKEGRRPVQARPSDAARAEERTRTMRSDSQIIAQEARQVSTELEKLCQEVFYSNSTDTSENTSSTSHAAYESPPSSLSVQDGVALANTSRVPMTPMAKYTKPRPTAETPNTFIARELLETRRRLAEKYGRDETLQTEAYHDLMSHLDSLLQPGTALVPDKRRSASDNNYMPHLPVISEEGRSEVEESRAIQGQYRRNNQRNNQNMQDPFSIRPVAPSSPPEIKPLTIRKNSSDSDRSKPSDGRGSSKPAAPQKQIKRKPTPPVTLVLGTIDEEGTKADQGGIPLKKENWFKRRFIHRDTSGSGRERSWEDLDDRLESKSSPATSNSRRSLVPGLISPSSRSSSQDVSKGTIGKRPGFLKFFSRKSKTGEKNIAVADSGASSSNTLVSSNGTRKSAPSTQTQAHGDHTIDTTSLTHPSDLGVSQNWLARFLNIKPASRILCFNCSRGRTRQELVRLLRKWRDLGITDIQLDRVRNLIFARLDGQNALARKFGLKEVSFAIEMYVVLERGRRAKLSIARFTQRKGSAASFRRVMEAAETSLRVLGVLVGEDGRRREMESVLGGG